MKKQYPIDSDTIIKILHRHNLGELKSFNPIKAGLINPAFLINDKYILRIDKSDRLKNVQGHSTRFEREALLYNLLPKMGIPTPQCLGLDSSREIIPEKYIIVSYIKGNSLFNGFKNCNKKTRQILSFQMGQLLNKIHDVLQEDLNGSSNLFVPSIDWKERYKKEFNIYLDAAIKGRYFNRKIEMEIRKTIKKFQCQISNLSNELRLVHGDFSVGNIQIDNGKIVGVFDFEWSHIGDPLWDLQKLPISFQLGDGFSRESFLKGYGMEYPTEEEQIRIKMYCLHQGIWEIWATKTQLFPFGEKEIAEGHQLVNAAIALWN